MPQSETDIQAARRMRVQIGEPSRVIVLPDDVVALVERYGVQCIAYGREQTIRELRECAMRAGQPQEMTNEIRLEA